MNDISKEELLLKIKELEKKNDYVRDLNNVLIKQSNNSLFYEGNVSEGAKELTKQVIESINADRCSIWLYNKDKLSIKCQQLYIKSEDKWYQDIELHKKNFTSYFEALQVNPIIIANDATTHPSTSCFTDTYLIPLGIKSMLDVPILYRGEIIGVICIESLSAREWCEFEVGFAQVLSSLYSFSYSIKEGDKKSDKIDELDKFVNEAAIISKANAKGKITYVNQKFTEVSGYGLDEVIGKDHNIVNSGIHPKEIWSEMYKKVIKERKVWNMIITNKAKNGNLYYVDTYIKAEFDSDNDELVGFISIRQDMTKIFEALNDLDEKNTYLEHAAKILRHDMHSGINTYIPRGLSSLERRLNPDIIEELKIEAPLRMIKEGLKHTQKVYKGVYEFTNLVKPNSVLTKTKCDLKQIIESYLSNTSYSSQVLIQPLIEAEVNESLFCTAIDNLIRNGLKYNDSETKFVQLFMRDEFLCIQDNGRGMTQEEFEKMSQPYVRKENQKESGSGLGLNICIAILKEHGFSITCEKNEIGTKMKIKI